MFHVFILFLWPCQETFYLSLPSLYKLNYITVTFYSNVKYTYSHRSPEIKGFPTKGDLTLSALLELSGGHLNQVDGLRRSANCSNLPFGGRGGGFIGFIRANESVGRSRSCHLNDKMAKPQRLSSPADALILAEEASHQRGEEIYRNGVASGEGRAGGLVWERRSYRSRYLSRAISPQMGLKLMAFDTTLSRRDPSGPGFISLTFPKVASRCRRETRHRVTYRGTT